MDDHAGREHLALGERIRAARVEAGLSLSEVARRAGVGKGTLSELEHGLRAPRLETLWALSTALGVPLGRFATSDGATAAGAAVEPVLVDRWTSDAFYELYRGTVGPETQHSPAHAAGVTEVLTVITGRLEAGPEEALSTAGPGESIAFAGSAPHRYRAVQTPCQVVIVIRYGSPPVG